MYDGEYAKTWIAHYESGDDPFRTAHLNPYLEAKLSALAGGSRILDVGCGWGLALEFLGPRARYYGVDVVPEFLEYVRRRHAGRVDLLDLSEGGLPDRVDQPDGFFDAVVCSMVLHTVPDLPSSVATLFSKMRDGGRLFIITFGDDSQDYLRSCFERVDWQTDRGIRGTFVLPSGGRVGAESYFHGERGYEGEIARHGTFSKRRLGPLFVAYECRK